MLKNPNNKYLFIISFLILLQLVFLFAVKYFNQDLSLIYFSPLLTGNIINLLIYLGLILGIFLGLTNKKYTLTKNSINSFLIISWFFLIISFISTKVNIIAANVYLYEQPGDKVLTGILFLLFLLSLFYYLVFVWSYFWGKKKLTFVQNFTGTVVISIASLILILLYIDNVGYASSRWSLQKSEKNIAVVLGAAVWSGNVPSPTLSSRVDKAMELLDNGFVGKIVFTGGSAPGELPEAEVAYEYAKVKGIDTSKVLFESLTANTAEQMKWIKNNLIEKADSIDDIIIVSDAYHLPRAIEISKFFELDLKVAESDHRQNAGDKLFTKFREAIALFNFWNFAL
jgi:vancomycin permeability regulator SanA